MVGRDASWNFCLPCLVVCGLALVAGCGKSPPKDANAARPVKTVPAKSAKVRYTEHLQDQYFERSKLYGIEFSRKEYEAKYDKELDKLEAARDKAANDAERAEVDAQIASAKAKHDEVYRTRFTPRLEKIEARLKELEVSIKEVLVELGDDAPTPANALNMPEPPPGEEKTLKEQLDAPAKPLDLKGLLPPGKTLPDPTKAKSDGVPPEGPKNSEPKSETPSPESSAP
ncbi:MAG: hypothetical protein QM811_05645 [Pirellulales bacterium]